jgi:hypothetical protein
MTPRYRMTPFAKLLIFLIFFVPIVLLGMNIYEGGDALDRIKTFIKSKTNNAPTEVISKDRFGVQVGTNQELIESKTQEIRELERRIKNLEREITSLKQ